MFSPKERDFLELIARCAVRGEEGQSALLAAFPNPTYRRKLLWGIRRKASDAVSDLQLYVLAASVESKVLPAPSPGQSVPLAADPLVTLIRALREILHPPRPRPNETTADRRKQEPDEREK